MGMSGLPGGGPWRILPECPAPYAHNTTFAAKKGAKVRRRQDSPRVKCICPRALAQLEKVRADARVAAKERGDRVSTSDHPGRPSGSGVPQYVRNVREHVEIPDLSDGECTTDVGQMIMDLAADSRWSGEPLAAAKSLCYRCPMEMECLLWAQKAEQPAGSWIGIYGGLTHMERRKRGAKAA